MKRKTDELLTKEQRRKLNDELIHFFKKENDIDVGMIFADDLITLFLEETGITIYNKGIEEAKKIILEKTTSLEIDLDAGKK